MLYVIRSSALKVNCTNAQHPDTYGHYREAIITAIKHHWWWKVRTYCHREMLVKVNKTFISVISCYFMKVNTVFDKLLATKDYNGYVFFLEEDHYVSPDFYEVSKQLIQLKQEKCHDCDFINLGMYTTQSTFSNKVRRSGFVNTQYT